MMARQRRSGRHSLSWPLLPVLVVLALLLPLSLALVVWLEAPQVEREALNHLSAMARLKAGQIHQWVQERRSDGLTLAKDRHFVAQVQRLQSAAGAAHADRLAVLSHLERLREHHPYDLVELLAPDGRLLVTTQPPGRALLAPPGPQAPAASLPEAYVDATGRAMLRWCVPVADPARADLPALGQLQLHMAPLQFLFPLIQTWPTASASGETLLVTRDGDQVVFMNQLRHRQGTAMTLRLRLSEPALPAAQALRTGQPGASEGTDYRGVPVLAAWLPVPGTDWWVVTKVDQAEVLAPVRVLAWWVSGVGALALAALAWVLTLLWRQAQRLQQLQVQTAHAQSDQLMTQLFSLPFVGIAIGNAQLTGWDRSNPSFCRIMGCTPAQLKTLRWADRVSEADWRADLAACQHLLAGEIEAHTADRRIHRPDGSDVVVSLQLRAMADSPDAAPRCIVVLQDITHRHKAEQGTKRHAQLFATLSACNQAMAQCHSEPALFARICRAVVQLGGMRLAWIGELDLHHARLRPVASDGPDAPLLDTLEVSARADRVFGLDSVGRAVREDQPVWVQDIPSQPDRSAWRDIAAQAQWGAMAALPLHRGGQVAAVLVLIDSQIHAFDDDARALLTELASNLDLALAQFEQETQRRHTEHLLQQSQARLELVLKGSSDAPWDWDLVTDRLDYSPQGWRMLGYGAEVAPTRPCAWSMILQPQHLALVEPLQQQLFESGALTLSMELRLRHKDGHDVPVLARGVVTRDDTGWPVRITGTHMDLSAQYQQHEVEAWRSHALGLVASGQTCAQVLAQLLHGLHALLTDAHAVLWLHSPDGHDLQPQGAAALQPLLARACDSPTLAEAEGPQYVVFDAQDERTPALKDGAWRARLQAVAQQAGLARCASVPVRASRAQVWGVLDLHRAMGAATAHERRLMDVMAHSVGLALDRHEAESQQRLATQVFEHSRDGITITDAQCAIVLVNPAFTRITGYELQEVRGHNPRLLSSGRQDAGFYARMWHDINTHGLWQGEIWNRRKNGEIFPEWLVISRMCDAQGQVLHYVAIFSDITQKKSDEERIRWMAHYDPLTGLPNRALLADRFTQAAGLAQRTSQPMALLMLDLDHFKNVNDSLGHGVGDELLRGVAQRMRQQMREQDTVARLGGDEFAVLLPGTDAHGAAHLAHKLMQSVATPLQVGEHELTVTPSIGIALFPQDGGDLGILSQHADTAMYRAKHGGRHACCFFAPEMQLASERNLLIEGALRRALQRRQLSLYYQPQIDIRSGRVTGVEALLRWHHPELGWVSPAEFVPIAEKSGLILPVGEWVLRTALAQLKAWMAAGLAPMTMAVNLSAVQFRAPNLSEQVGQMLADSGLEPRYLELELTEGVASDDPVGATAIMDALHDRGVCMSIDDFGTGYSSLSYLKRFKVYKLKIDQSFVRDVILDPDDKAIVCAIIHLARSLGLQTIAEGVETPEQLAFLADQGCDEVQGYLYSRPLPAEDCAHFLRMRQFETAT